MKNLKISILLAATLVCFAVFGLSCARKNGSKDLVDEIRSLFEGEYRVDPRLKSHPARKVGQ